ncbi:transcriptional repressor LexA [bacterium]|nr:transcriptional repressor LexA [bacterium]
MELNDKQKNALDFIVRYLREHDRPPTLREVGKAIGVSSTNGVRYLIDGLISKGYLSRSPSVSRGISLTDKTMRQHGSLRMVPLIGRIAAGSPLLAEENLEGQIAVDPNLIGRSETFALRVKGESMRDAGIMDGDVLFARPQSSAQKGDIVIALLDNEATVKYFRPEGNRICLQPANPKFNPIFVEKKSPDFRILGKVIGLMRKI